MFKKLLVILCMLAHSAYAFHNVDANLIKKYLPENPVILEAGAYKGAETIEFTKVWPGAVIYAFEPAPKIFEELQKNVSHCRNVKVYPLALSDHIGYADFYLSIPDARNDRGCDQSSSLLEPKLHYAYSTNVLFTPPIKVRTITLDEWAKNEGVEHIDFIWFDLQGVEREVLKASPKILKTVKAIFTEVNYVELYKGNCLYEQYKQWLCGEGFIEVHHSPQAKHFGDALFVRKELR